MELSTAVSELPPYLSYPVLSTLSSDYIRLPCFNLEVTNNNINKYYKQYFKAVFARYQYSLVNPQKNICVKRNSQTLSYSALSLSTSGKGSKMNVKRTYI